MNTNKERVLVIIMLAAWCFAGSIFFSRWETVVDYFSANTTAATSPSGAQHQKETTEVNSTKTEVKKSMGTPQPLSGATQATSVSLSADELVLRVSDLSGKEGPIMNRSNVAIPGKGVVETINTSGLGREQGWRFISKLVEEGRLDFRAVAKYPLEDEYLTLMDQEILADGPVKDLTRVASPETSQLELIGLNQGREVKVGENVTVRVILKDTEGRPVLKGSHQVRIWMVSKEKITRSAAVDVTDLQNGTYVTSLPVLWPGLFEIRAALMRPREFRRLVLSLMNTMKMMYGVVASFVSGTTEEVTLCSFIPVVPGYQEVCNLTTLNSGLPWFCGRPSAPGLKCRDWAWSSHLNFPSRYPVTDTENALMRQFNSGKDCTKKLVEKILLTAVQDPQKKAPVNKEVCQPLKPRETWEDRSPRGYWENNAWRPLAGCPLPPLKRSVIFECLHDTHFISIGDSNAQRVADGIQGETRCVRQPDPKRSTHTLHVPLTFHCPEKKLWISWYPHAYPFFTGMSKWSDARVKHAPSHVLDALPTTGKYIIVIHLYVHFSPVHTYIYTQHIRDTARAVRDLLKRNPEVKVFIRGPHAMGGTRFELTSDFHSERCLRVLKHEFRDLRERVVLLNTLDMTVAIENCPIHPFGGVVTAVCRMLLSHVCPNHFKMT